MLSDRIISYASRFVAMNKHDLLLFGLALVVCMLFWSALYFSRKRVVIVRRSSGTDQLTFELSRIADALERIAGQSTDRVIAVAARRQRPSVAPTPVPPAPVAGVARPNPYSIFNR